MLADVQVKAPKKLKPLLFPKRYKGAYGGRGGAKSHFFAQLAIARCCRETSRIVCIREVQNSIRDSVRQLLIDKISELGLEADFEVFEGEIRGPYGSLVIFKGMQSYNADNIKSLEAYDVAWVEEAQTFSQRSLDLLRPTLRKPGSELWFSWNPRFKTDPVDKFFRKNPPPDAISVMVNWRDNPWFPDVLKKEMAHDFALDEDKADHIWNGAYGSSAGAILSRWVNAAEREGRISNLVVFDPLGAPVEVSSDIGFRDTASWWYWQRKLGGFAVLKYDFDSGLDADDWIPRIRDTLTGMGINRLWKIWLPQDAKAKTFQSKYSSAEKFLTAFGANKVDIVPKAKKSDQISAARRVIKKSEFHREMCEDGIDGLLAWEFEWIDDDNVFSREPLHNWASHPGDAYAYGAQVMEESLPQTNEKEEPRHLMVGPGNRVTLNDMWATVKPSGRI
ncbi:MAG: PBSX family phage terminase large subunit [Candidatus Binatia bacterium]|nr:PBSX family phage terminase large subunit [Candidatus Binatia bacterium]